MIVIALANQKGGTGKTTSTIELAACFKNMGYKVLVVDLDQQTNLSRYVGADTRLPGIYNVLKKEVDVLDAIQHLPEFDVLSSSPSLSKADREFSESLDVMLLKDSLKPLNDIYDLVLIDNNPSRNILLNMTYIASDYVIIPADCDEGSIMGIHAILEDLDKYVKAGWSDADFLGIIFTKYEKTGMHKYALENIQELLNSSKSDAFVKIVRKSIAASECKSEGTSMQLGKKNSNPAIDYKTIAEDIINIIA